MPSKAKLSLFAAATTAAALSLAGGILAPAIAQPASQAWAATATKALHLDGQLLGSVPQGQQLHISVALPLRDEAGVAQLLAEEEAPSSPYYHHFLTPDQTAARFGPSQEAVSAVRGYLERSGFSAVTVAADRLLVSGDATAGAVERAFDTRLSDFELDGREVYANVVPAKVPAALAGDVAAVLGLSDVPMNLPLAPAPRKPSRTAAIAASQARHGSQACVPPASPGNFAGFYPRAVQTMYDAQSMEPASGQRIAIVASGDMTPTIANLRYAEANQCFPAVPVTVEYAAPKATVVTNNPYTGNAEWDLDTQMSTMVAGSVAGLYIYDIPNLDDADVARAINMFVEQDLAMAGSASLGECDVLPYLDGAMLTTDEILSEGALQGQSFFASAGDNGYACPEIASTGVPGGVPGTSWPADGIYTTAVGGTTVIANSQGQVSNEIAWIGGGGGISNFEVAPTWTYQDNPAGEAGALLVGGRGVPDVAADADNNVSPVLIYVGKPTGYEAVGGTSVSSPLTMGLWARVQQADGGSLGLASYDFYGVYNAVNPGIAEGTPLGTEYLPDPDPKPVTGFRDIIIGTNGLYTARPGYDYTTGIGSVQAGALATVLAPKPSP